MSGQKFLGRNLPSMFLFLSLAIVDIGNHGPSSSKGELFTALADLQSLVYHERDVVNTLRKYINEESERLEEIKKHVEEYRVHNQEALKDPQQYLANPVNSYLLIKKFTIDWEELQDLIKKNHAIQAMNNISSLAGNFPTGEDLTGAAAGLMRLQDTYKLDTKSMAKGEFGGVKVAAEMNTQDCYDLGRVAYNKEDYYHTVLWMEEAYRKAYDEDPGERLVPIEEILDYLAFAHYKEGMLKRAYALTKELKRLSPDHPRVDSNLQYFNHLLQGEDIAVNDGPDTAEAMPAQDPERLEKILPKRKADNYLPEREKYEALCRGDPEALKLTPKRERKLKCFHRTWKKPTLMYAPAKIEEVFDRPKVYSIKQVITDKENQYIRDMASPRLYRATIHNPQTGKLEHANYRVSKSAWLKKRGADPVINRITDRLEAITNLNMDVSEDLQVVNYGIGGHYEPHFDFARKTEPDAFKELGTGNRIATILFYLSDVAAGGATVFPTVGASVTPEKNSAAFWYNLLPSGEGDYDTRHAACPVLVGTKWVANYWVHEVGQEFRRPCRHGSEDVNNDYQLQL